MTAAKRGTSASMVGKGSMVGNGVGGGVVIGEGGAERSSAGGEGKYNLVKPKTTINFAYVSYAFLKGYRYCCLEGSSRSGKTWAVLQWCVFACLRPKTFIPGFERDSLEIRCMRHDETTARETIYDDLMKILTGLGFVNGQGGFKVNQRDLKIEFPNKSQIIFGGASEPGKLHGLGSDIVFFNEAMMISKAAVDQMEMRTRVGFIFDWNPSLNEHWIFKQGFDKTSNYGDDEKLAGSPKVFYAHSTYKDNLENLTPGQIASIEQYEPTPGNISRGTANRHMWEIYGLGKRGYMEGRVVDADRVSYVNPEEFPTAKQWELHGYGLDWGFSADPTALVECAIWNKKLYVRELIYRKGMMVSPDPTLPAGESVIAALKELDVKSVDVIVADSARKDLNEVLRRAGFCVLDAYKPGGSIENGVNLMNQRRWCVTDNSPNLKFELENWVWGRTRYGEQTNKPVDKHNHLMDAVRYWLTTFVDSSNAARLDSAPRNTKHRYACSLDLW